MRVLMVFFFLSFLMKIPALAINENDIIGTFWGPDKDGQIEIYKVGDKFYGKIIWTDKPRKDTKNPEPSLRNRDVVGSVVLNDFVYDGKGTWKDGTIYDAKTGKTYNCQITLDEKGDLNVRGYVGIPLLGRTEVLTRVE